jgi:tetratricopeptide (TPR) repeat protein
MSDVTHILKAIDAGDPHAASQLLPLVYDELRRLAAQRLVNEKPGQTLDATALVHEAYLRLAGDQHFDNRRHFFAAAAEATRLSVPERLSLFVQVCQAVQHAHQKGIIHRDLKPSNILVAPYDDKPVPKVIDFGLAKAMHQPLTERTLHTAHETVLGTPLYMSPEQAQLNNLDVDTRSDIYSLGVLLYELLTGTTPLERRRFREAAWEEIKRLIREEEPPRPSARLSSTHTLPSLAASRQTEPARLTKLVRGELDWIVMKALEKDRGRRYETANGFGLDIQRHLAGEPVLAAPPSARYRLRKFARKHRAALTTAAVLALLLVVGVAVSTWQAVRATRAEQEAWQAQRTAAERTAGERLAKLEAQAQKAVAEQAATAEKVAKEQAQKRLAQIEKANDLLGSIFENLDPNEIAKAERPLQAVLVEQLDKAVAQLEGESIGDPLVVAVMQAKFGKSLLGLGEWRKAIVLLEKARATLQAKLGPDHSHTLTNMNNLAMGYLVTGKRDLALPLFEEALQLRKARLGSDHPDTLLSLGNLAVAYWQAKQLDKSIPLFEETLKRCEAKFGRDHADTLLAVAWLGVNYQEAGRLQEALPLLEEAYRAAKKYPALSWVGKKLLDTYVKTGEKAKLVNLGLEQLPEFRKALPKDSPQLANLLAQLGMGLLEQKQWTEAESLLRECLAIREKTQPDVWSTFNTKSLLGGALLGQKKHAEAEPLLLAGYQGMKQREAKIPPPGRMVRLTEAVERLVQLYDATGNQDEAAHWRKEREATKVAQKQSEKK